MPRTLATIAIGAGLALASACSDPAGAPADTDAPLDDYQLPEPDTSLNPDRLSVGEYIATPCAFGQWGNGLAHLRDRNEWALVDVFFGRGSAEGPWDGPVADDVELVESHGGRVSYRFHVPAVRARLLLSRIPDLVKDGYWITVRDVPDATRYDVPLTVGLTHLPSDDDYALFESLGGRITYRFQNLHALSGILPDRSIAVFQHRPDVAFVQTHGVACLASPARP